MMSATAGQRRRLGVTVLVALALSLVSSLLAPATWVDAEPPLPAYAQAYGN